VCATIDRSVVRSFVHALARFSSSVHMPGNTTREKNKKKVDIDYDQFLLSIDIDNR
jgi:hypothetical protein